MKVRYSKQRVRFVCKRPGYWRSEDGRIHIYRMLADTSQEMWEAYADKDCRKYLTGEMSLTWLLLTL